MFIYKNYERIFRILLVMDYTFYNVFLNDVFKNF